METIAILGCGSRGRVYCNQIALHHLQEVKIVAVCDQNAAKAQEVAGLSRCDPQIFTDTESFFKQGKLADVLVIATQDKDHHAHAMRALALGYNLLLEKPVATNQAAVQQIADTAAEKGCFVLVCHVLRYSAFYKKIAELLHSGAVGQVMNIEHTENVGYWHFAHSFVRGPWRNGAQSNPLCVAKCCHDFDLLYWYMGCDCTAVSSYGSRRYFCTENKPEGAAQYCLQNCPAGASCPYSAAKIYLEPSVPGAPPISNWASTQITGKPNPTDAELRAALTTGPYGRCVFACDNTVCDHQVISMTWQNGATATLTINPFSKDCYRRISVSGTLGELYGADCNDYLTLNTFLGNKSERISLADSSTEGHCGGDKGLIDTLVKVMKGEAVEQDYLTTIDRTLKSHRIAFAAEECRGSAVQL